MGTDDVLMTPEDAAIRLNLTPRTILQHLKSGKLRGYKIGRLWRIAEADLQQFLAASATVPRAS